MTAQVIRLADHRRKRRETDAMSLMLGGMEFLALCNIAVLYALVCACRIAKDDSARKG